MTHTEDEGFFPGEGIFFYDCWDVRYFFFFLLASRSGCCGLTLNQKSRRDDTRHEHRLLSSVFHTILIGHYSTPNERSFDLTWKNVDVKHIRPGLPLKEQETIILPPLKVKSTEPTYKRARRQGMPTTFFSRAGPRDNVLEDILSSKRSYKPLYHLVCEPDLLLYLFRMTEARATVAGSLRS